MIQKFGSADSVGFPHYGFDVFVHIIVPPSHHLVWLGHYLGLLALGSGSNPNA